MFDFDLNKISYLANVAGALVLVFTLGKLSDYSKEVTILEQALKENNQTVIKLNSELERTNKVLLETETARDALIAKQNSVKNIKKEVVKDGQSKDWNNDCLPAGVRSVIDGLRANGN